MRYRKQSSDETALREFGGLTEVSTHAPFAAEPVAHRHFAAYVAIVLSGEYAEISADGVIQAGPGDVLTHPALHCHANVFTASRVAVLNLELPMSLGLNVQYASLRLADLPFSLDDVVAKPVDCAASLSTTLARKTAVEPPPPVNDIVGFAERRLKAASAPKVGRVAAEVGVSTEHLIRAFRRRHGLSPGQYRAEHRFRHAVRKLSAGESGTDTACHSGYSDQSHMTRDFRKRTGMTPTQLSRRLHKLQTAT